MVITELIEKLQEIKKKEGDLHVYAFGGGWDAGNINEIDYFDLREEDNRFPKRLILE